MTEAERIAIFTTLGMIFGGVLSTLLQSYFNRKNSFFQSLKNATEALNITTDELVENLVALKTLRKEVEEKDKIIKKLEANYKTLKDITRKLYKNMQDAKIDPELSDAELEMLYDTQPLMLFREQEKRRRKLEGNT